MDIKFLEENDANPDKAKGNRWIIYVLLIAVIITGVSFLFITQNRNESISTNVSSLSNSRDLTAQQSSLIANVASSSKAKIFEQSSDWRLLLVNAKTKIPENLNPQIVNYDNIQMDKRILPYFLQMKAAAANDGITLWLSGGYRSIEDQQQLLQRTVQSNINKGLSQSDAEQQARKVVAEPGYSEHNTGLALDFNGSRSDFVSTDAYAWLQKHTAEYGFVLRYPQGKESITGNEFQPWFYRYVGVDNALKMNAEKQCLEEFLHTLM